VSHLHPRQKVDFHSISAPWIIGGITLASTTMRRPWLAATLALALAQGTSAFVFEVANNTIAECGKTLFTWSKGSPPYSLNIIVSAID
jgi:hypothetical protein